MIDLLSARHAPQLDGQLKWTALGNLESGQPTMSAAMSEEISQLVIEEDAFLMLVGIDGATGAMHYNLTHADGSLYPIILPDGTTGIGALSVGGYND